MGGLCDRLDEITYLSVKVWPPSMKRLWQVFPRALMSIPSIMAIVGKLVIAELILFKGEICVVGSYFLVKRVPDSFTLLIKKLSKFHYVLVQSLDTNT